MKALLDRFNTYRKLGIFNIIRVSWYRGLLKSGVLKYKLPVLPSIKGTFFLPSIPTKLFDFALKDEWSAYSIYPQPLNSLPRWHIGIPSGKSFDNVHHWTEIRDFSGSDIKDVWELSRFEWIFPFIFRFLQTHDTAKIDRLNLWLEDWSAKNPCNQGVNWKCGQEASIRVLHVVVASILLGQHTTPTEALIELVRQHLMRIRPTRFYAVAQNNNHAISEAAACLMGGWLLQNSSNTLEFGKDCEQIGRTSLEKLISRLILQDGTFSQYSVNYHRLMLDVCAYTELGRKIFGQPAFSDIFYEAMRKATTWLYSMVDSHTGDAPNSGANDGAYLFPIAQSGYRDYRPTVQLASAVFYNTRAYIKPGTYDASLHLFKLNTNKKTVIPQQNSFLEGGYSILSNKNTRLILRHPRFKFRPSHCDALHLDVWVRHQPIAHDDGSYRYYTPDEHFFGMTSSHNTVQFDNHEQMSKLSRFLYGNWVHCKFQPIEQTNEFSSVAASYTDRKGCTHIRQIRLEENKAIIEDSIGGFNTQAVLRWHLAAHEWKLNGHTLSTANITIRVDTDNNQKIICSIRDGFESLFYSQKTSCQVFEIIVSNPCTIKTVISWEQEQK